MYSQFMMHGQKNIKLLYYISNKGLAKEHDKEENLEVTGASATCCLKRRL